MRFIGNGLHVGQKQLRKVDEDFKVKNLRGRALVLPQSMIKMLGGGIMSSIWSYLNGDVGNNIV